MQWSIVLDTAILPKPYINRHSIVDSKSARRQSATCRLSCCETSDKAHGNYGRWAGVSCQPNLSNWLVFLATVRDATVGTIDADSSDERRRTAQWECWFSKWRSTSSLFIASYATLSPYPLFQGLSIAMGGTSNKLWTILFHSLLIGRKWGGAIAVIDHWHIALLRIRIARPF